MGPFYQTQTTPINPGDADHYDAETGAWDRQLPNADIAKATQPDMWEGVDVSAFGADRPRFIENLQRADRMELAAALADVSPTARLVAVVLASHGWISWPGRDRLATLLQMERQNISRATKELETAGIIAKLQPYATSKSVTYIFQGRALLEADAKRNQGRAKPGIKVIPERTVSDANLIPETTPGRAEFSNAAVRVGINMIPTWNQSDTQTGIEQEGGSSSDADFSKTGPGLADARRVRARENQSFSEEEGPRSEAERPRLKIPPGPASSNPPNRADKLEAARDWIDRMVSPVPMDGEISYLLDRTWSVWEFPAHPYGWKYGKPAAFKTCTASVESRRKFRADLVEHFAKVGPPETSGGGGPERLPVPCLDCGNIARTGKRFNYRGKEHVENCEHCQDGKA